MDDFERKGIGPRRPTRLGDFSGLKVEVDPLSSALVMVVKCVEAYLAMVWVGPNSGLRLTPPRQP